MKDKRIPDKNSRFSFTGDPGFCSSINHYIQHNHMGGGDNEVRICAIAGRETLAALLEKEPDCDLYILGSGLVADIYENNRGLYQLYEDTQAEILKEKQINSEFIKLMQTDSLFHLLKKNKGAVIPADKRRVHCFWPWFNMYLRGDIVEWCCGYNHTGDRLTQEGCENADIMTWWNHEAFKTVRRVISDRDVKGNCSRCHNLYFNQFFPYVFDFQLLNKHQEANLTSAVHQYWQKAYALDSSPVRYELITTFRCNINCIMCNQDMYKHNRYALTGEFFVKNREKLSRAVQISLLGGEFFFLEESRNIIKELGRDEYMDTQIMFITNGLQIDKFFDDLVNIKKALFSISLDGVGATYEAIRKGSKWHRVENNLFRLRELIRERALDWEIQIPSVVMHESIKGLGEFTDWCIEHNFSPSFIKMEHVEGVTESQDVFRSRELLNSIDNWKEIFSDALDKLEKNKLYNSYYTLGSIYKSLLNRDGK